MLILVDPFQLGLVCAMPQCPNTDVEGCETWHRLPREVMAVPSLETFRAGLDRALNSLIQLRTSLLIAGGLELDL